MIRTDAARERKRARDRAYNARRTGGNSMSAARWRAQKRRWWRDNRGTVPIRVMVAP